MNNGEIKEINKIKNLIPYFQNGEVPFDTLRFHAGIINDLVNRGIVKVSKNSRGVFLSI